MILDMGDCFCIWECSFINRWLVCYLRRFLFVIIKSCSHNMLTHYVVKFSVLLVCCVTPTIGCSLSMVGLKFCFNRNYGTLYHLNVLRARLSLQFAGIEHWVRRVVGMAAEYCRANPVSEVFSSIFTPYKYDFNGKRSKDRLPSSHVWWCSSWWGPAVFFNLLFF